MDIIPKLLEAADSFLMAPYRLFGNPVIGWWLGIFVLAMWTTLLGQLTMALVFRVNRKAVKETVEQVSNHHHQSMNALRSGNKPAYKAINKLANEAYGKTFFLQVAMASSSLWPVPLALAWLEIRFSSVDFPFPLNLPFLDGTVSFVFIFILVYIFTRIMFNGLKGWLHRGKGK
ncbi:MAG TPA: hypothetical protein HPP90_13110 [Deltaproteobacteria bacterium]|nr:hypothetical protein [Deltaproteobacteria bacterium]